MKENSILFYHSFWAFDHEDPIQQLDNPSHQCRLHLDLPCRISDNTHEKNVLEGKFVPHQVPNLTL